MAQLTHLAHRLYEHVRREGVLPRGAHIVVACSGGPDSLALLSLLLELRPLLSLAVTAAHYEHGIRGEASAEDAAFVRRFCATRAVPCIVESGDVPRAAARTSESLETAARRLRYAFLERTRERVGASLIATAHHADDQAETVLLHILRGTGLDGLAGIPARDAARHLVRPLLPFPKQELVDYCRARGFSPRHDATNDVPDALRNRVRLSLLPELARAYNSAIRQGLCRLADIAAEEREAAEHLAAQEAVRLIEQLPAGRAHGEDAASWRLPAAPALRAEAARALPRALCRRVLRIYLARLGRAQDVSFERTEALRRLLSGTSGQRVELPRLVIAYDSGWLRPAVKKYNKEEESNHDEG